MPKLNPSLEIDRCPHCKVDKPNLSQRLHTKTNDHRGGNIREWIIYVCARCGGLVTASAPGANQEILKVYPTSPEVDQSIPSPANDYLKQAIDSLHSPAGAVMLAASSVDAMLKAKEYKEGSLYARIDKAKEDNLITSDMADWAHNIRLDANDQRHADEETSLPDEADAQRSIDFAQALGQFMFMLPARVTRGLKEIKDSSKKETDGIKNGNA